MEPFGAGGAGDDPKAAGWNLDGDALVAVAVDEIEDDVGPEADAGDGGAEGGVIAVRGDSEGRDVFIDDAVFGEALHVRIGSDAMGEVQKPGREITNPGGLAAFAGIADAVLLDTAAPVVFPWAVVELGEE